MTAKLVQQCRTNARIALRWVGLSSGRETANQVGPADDTDELVAAQHRDALDSVRFHDFRYIVDIGRLADAHDVGCHYFLCGYAVRADIASRGGLSADKQMQPAMPRALVACFRTAQQISLADDSDDCAILNHRNCADAMHEQESDHSVEQGI